MPERLWNEWWAWWAAAMPEFRFLLALPFVIGAIALLGDAVRRRCARD